MTPSTILVEPIQPRCSSSATDWFGHGILLGTLLACAVALSPSVADPDLWGHVRYGQDALRDGLASTATYTFTAEGYRWINHENLSELLMALVASYGGGTGLLTVKCVLGVLVIAAVLRSAQRHQVRLMTMCVVALLTAFNLTYHWSMRPQVFSFSLYAALLVVTGRAFRGWEGVWHIRWPRRWYVAPELTPVALRERLRWLWLSPVIFAVWANTHGAFVAGYLVFTSILFLRGVELCLVFGRAAWRAVMQLGVVALTSALATLINPYTYRLHVWLGGALSAPRPEIREWHPLRWDDVHALPFALMLAVGAAAVLRSRRSKDATHLIVLAITLWQSLRYQRHLPFFVIPFGLWLPMHMDALMYGNGRRSEDDGWAKAPRWLRRALVGSLAGAFLILAVRLSCRLSHIQVRCDQYPVAAMQYLADRGLQGKLLVTFNWAQYAIAAVGPQRPDAPGTRVAFDGRFRTCYPQAVIDCHFDFILGEGGPDRRYRSPDSPPVDPARALEWGRPDLVLISRLQEHSAAVMQRHREQWTLLYQDQLAQLWGRKEKYGEPASPDFVDVSWRAVGDQPQIGHVAWPALPMRKPLGLFAQQRREAAAARVEKANRS